MGMNYRTFVENVRRTKSTYLLCHTDLSVREISEICGYSDPSNFSKAFKLWTGASPREYRIGYASIDFDQSTHNNLRAK